MQRVRKQVEDSLGERCDGGHGVTVAVLDTGYRVIIMSSQQNHRKIKGSRWFSPTKKCQRRRY